MNICSFFIFAFSADTPEFQSRSWCWLESAHGVKLETDGIISIWPWLKMIEPQCHSNSNNGQICGSPGSQMFEAYAYILRSLVCQKLGVFLYLQDQHAFLPT